MSGRSKPMYLIVAMDLDKGIGKNGTLPWALKKDMAFFRQKTLAVVDEQKRNAVIMGRKCWDSIPEKFRPLKDRLNIVISRSLEPVRSENLVITSDFDGILNELNYSELGNDIETVWNIGGAEIYNQSIEKELASKIFVTQINHRYDTDVKLNLDLSSFEEILSMRSEEITENDINFTFHVYQSRT